MTETAHYSNRRPEKAIEIEQADGTNKRYIIRRFNAKQRANHLNMVRNKLAINPEGRVLGVANHDGWESHLIAMCLFEEGADKPVSQAEIDGWDPELVDALHRDCRDICGLDKKKEELLDDAKKL